MSAIFGILNLNGQPVADELLQAMRDRLALWWLGGSSVWNADSIGLGHLQSFGTPESPLQDPTSGIALTTQSRLDNRATLIAEFAAQCWGDVPNNKLILQAYLRWGSACVQHLSGDWAFALWDSREHKLLLARDHHGISALYYYLHPRFIAFASSIKGLFALSDVPQRPNLLRVAQVLASWPGDGIQTGYQGIFRLAPAHILTVTSGRVETRPYWSPENVAPVRFASDAEYVEAFLDIYTDAVRSRLRSDRPIAATLSSGLDSGSVCALAARELRTLGKCLPVFTSVPLYDPTGGTSGGRCGDESPLVETDRQFIGNLDVQYVRAENVSPLAGIGQMLDVHDEPGHAAGNLFWITALLQCAQQQGIGVLLTGQLGNGTISWVGGLESLWRLMLPGRWRKALGLEPSLWLVIKRHLLRPLVQPWREQAERFRFIGREPWTEYSALNQQFACSLDFTRQMRASGHDPFFNPPSDPVQARLKIIQPGASIAGPLWAENSAAFALDVRDPTMDKRLLEFCLAIPDEQYRGDGQDRWLIRRAMQGLLPDAVRLNTRRGLQAADLGYRLLATLPEVQSTLARLEQSPLASEVLDLPKMQRVLHDLQKQLNPTTTNQCVTILTRGMMAGLFLLRFD